jgi:ATP-dependent exoDNAse (exonuclease V) beta subunit
MLIYGFIWNIWNSHTKEACPLYNDESRKYLLRVAPTMAKDAEKSNVNILNQFHSALEHTFLWVAEADNPHIIEELWPRQEVGLIH